MKPSLWLSKYKSLLGTFSRIARVGSTLGALLAISCSSGEPVDGLGPIPTGSLSLGIDGLPAGVPGSVTVSGAQGFQKSLTTGQTLAGLTPGSYMVSAAEINSDGDRYTPAPASQSVAVTSGSSPVTASVSYQLMTGRLAVSISGLPTGVNGAVLVVGPAGYVHTVLASETLTGLVPGTYIIQSPSQVIDGDRFDAQVTSQQMVVAAIQGVTGLAAVNYSVSTGVLGIVVEGLPEGTDATVGVTGPQAFHAAVTSNTTLSGLVPGNYSISAGNVTAGGVLFVPSLTDQSASVLASQVPVVRTIAYSQAIGALTVTVTGLPGSVPANVTVSGPGGYLQNLTGSQALSGLLPGIYTVSAFSVTTGGTTYNPAPTSQNITVSFGTTASAGVTYGQLTGSLQVVVSGLPSGTAANGTVSGPGGFSQHFTTSKTLTGLTPGTYTISAVPVTSSGVTYQPVQASQTAAVTGAGHANAAVLYTSTTGTLTVTIGGLPAGTSANVTVTGPGGFSQLLTTSHTFSGLAPGSYSIASVAVVSGASTYTPAPLSQSVAVSAGAVSPASVFYSSGGGGGATLNLTIAGVYLTQATQRPDGSVPLVAGRDAYLRVFALANQTNTAQPQVRVRLYSGASLIQTYTITAPAPSVPLAVNEGSLTSSWNVLVPAALVQPNLKVLADVDPASAVPESSESDNQFPVSGVAGAVDVRTLPAYQVRLVPILQQVNGLQGNVTAGNMNSFLPDLLQQLPVSSYNADVRAPYTTTAPALQSNDGNGAWGTILSEMLAVRAGDASSRYYYGVVKASYGGGVAGMGYVGGSARAAIGWDNLPSGSGVMAHETGHNMGRQHSPCGGPAGPDPSYPYAGGMIGMWGLDLTTLTLKSPAVYADLMSYCNPSWVSDYSWTGMVGYRQGGPNNAPASSDVAGPGLLVWGRITAGGVVLEPAFRLPSASGRTPAPGVNRLDLLAADGSLLGSVAFESDEVADGPNGVEQHFAFVIPLDPALERDLSGLRVRAGFRTATQIAPLAGGDPAPTMTRVNSQQVDVRWDAARFPMVMVRDAATGDILSFARGGAARVWARGSNFLLSFSDGVKSVARQGRVLR